ncbi:MarR family transcriptional regulator [Arcicella sp. DC2W]|uniref:MarR family transcriptional regulator n=1 Tax=Arcicella gelida TaxID=2984195 RepID=A0ABU5S6W4_9BACT|nr:MarR family transcriptional regulator [Arcicella sp. DC2W]MEA5404233.1 MarR family transcriptional regulator [Arcicella sp. DC2W]
MNEDKLSELYLFKQDKDRHIGRLIAKSHRLVREIASEFLRAKGYTNFRVGHMVALIHIDLEGSNINNLASLAGVTKQAMSKLVKELQDEGFVSIEKHPNDARTLIVKLSDKGISTMLHWKECTANIESKFAEVIGLEKVEQLKNILSDVVSNYDSNNSLFMSDKSLLNQNLADSNPSTY